MTELSLRDRLIARKSEIEQALADLDRIEQLASGEPLASIDASIAQPNPPVTESIAQRVYEAILGKSFTVEQLASKLGHSVPQIRNALTGHRLRNKIEAHKAGGLTRYTIPVNGKRIQQKSSQSDLPTVRTAVLTYLSDSPDKSFRTIEISRALEGKVASSAKNFSGTVAATLSDLVKHNRVLRDKHGYRAAPEQRSLLSGPES